MTSTSRPRRTRLPASPFISPARPLSALASETLAQAFGRRGFANGDILSNWKVIAGEELARRSQPEKISWPRRPGTGAAGDETGHDEGATLYLRVEGPAAIEVQHMVPQILERINRFLGFAAISRLRILQAPVTRTPDEPAIAPRRARTGPPKEMDKAIEAEIKSIKDPELAAALVRLARASGRSAGKP